MMLVLLRALAPIYLVPGMYVLWLYYNQYIIKSPKSVDALKITSTCCSICSECRRTFCISTLIMLPSPGPASRASWYKVLSVHTRRQAYCFSSFSCFCRSFSPPEVLPAKIVSHQFQLLILLSLKPEVQLQRC